MMKQLQRRGKWASSLGAAPAAMRLTLLLLLAVCVLGHPRYFVEEYATDCEDHPEGGFRSHHGGKAATPIEDPATTFTVAAAGSTAGVTTLCPGTTYAVSLSFPEAREALLTSTVGTFGAAPDATCPNRVFSRINQRMTVWNAGSLKVKLTQHEAFNACVHACMCVALVGSGGTHVSDSLCTPALGKQ